MTKKDLNQNAKYVHELINIIEPKFVFNSHPINRFAKKDNLTDSNLNKKDKLLKLKFRINSIENCALKEQSKNLVLGDGNINSSIMIIGEAPSADEEKLNLTFQGDVGKLLEKMFLAISVDLSDIYKTYSINFRTPEDRKPTTKEIKRYSPFLKDHVSIINPKIIILMGSTAMESIINSNNKISVERGKWKEIILKNKTYPIMVTYSPSYLVRYPENKKYSWEDLKKIKKKIQELNINI